MMREGVFSSALEPGGVAEGPMLPEPIRIELVEQVGDRVKIVGEGLHSGGFHKALLAVVPTKVVYTGRASLHGWG